MDPYVSRRRFVAGAGTLAAASDLRARRRSPRGLTGRRAPTSAAAASRRASSAAIRRRTASRCGPGSPASAGRGSVELEVARDKAFRTGRGARAGGDERRPRPRGQGPGHAARSPTSSTTTASRPGRRTARRPLPDRAARPTRASRCTFAFFSCQDYTFGYFNAHARPGRRGRRLRRQPRRLHLRRGLPHKGSTGPAACGPIRLGESATLDEYRRKYELYRSDPDLRRMHANFPMISTWDDHEVQDNYAGGAGPEGGLDRQGLLRGAARPAYRAFFESHADLRPAAQEGTRIYRGIRFGRNVDLLDDRRAPVPRRPALRRRAARRRVPRAQRAAPVPRTLADGLPEVAPERLAGGVEGDRQRGDDHEHHLPGREVHRLRLLAGLRRRAHRAAPAHPGSGASRTSSSSPATSTRSSPATSGSPGPTRKAVATEFVGGSITSQGLGEGGGGTSSPAADPINPNTPRAITDLLFQRQPVGQGRRHRPPRLRRREGDARRVHLHPAPRRGDAPAHAADADQRRVPVHGAPGAAEPALLARGPPVTRAFLPHRPEAGLNHRGVCGPRPGVGVAPHVPGLLTRSLPAALLAVLLTAPAASAGSRRRRSRVGCPTRP